RRLPHVPVVVDEGPSSDDEKIVGADVCENWQEHEVATKYAVLPVELKKLHPRRSHIERPSLGDVGIDGAQHGGPDALEKIGGLHPRLLGAADSSDQSVVVAELVGMAQKSDECERYPCGRAEHASPLS